MSSLTTLLLGKHPWIAGLPADQVNLIGEHAREVRFHAGQVISPKASTPTASG